MKNKFQKQLNILILLRSLLLIASVVASVIVDWPPELRQMTEKYNYEFLALIDESAVNVIYWIYTAIQFIILPIIFWKNKIYSIYICLALHLLDFILLYGGHFDVISSISSNLFLSAALVDGAICSILYLNNYLNTMQKIDLI
jgi:hypothetical protein